MIDTVAILSTHLFLLYVIARAFVLDRKLPWFEPADEGRITTK